MRRRLSLLMGVAIVSGLAVWAVPSERLGVATAEVPGASGRIAYVTDSRGCDDCHVFTVAPDGSDRIKLTDLAIGGPRWSPDGTRLSFPAVAPDGRITTATIDADGTDLRMFDLDHPTRNVACWGWTPDGTRLTCEVWDESRPQLAGGVFTVDATDGSDLRRLTKNPYGSGDFTGDYSPDGSRYAFIRTNDGRRNGNSAVFLVNSDGTGETRITPWSLNAGTASWSPDGERILFDGGGTFSTVRPDGSDLETIVLDTGDITGFAFEPSWSPDGTRIVFTMWVEAQDQVDIFTVAADGSDLVRITDSKREDGFPDWGPALSV